jgi:hypothetical protein
VLKNNYVFPGGENIKINCSFKELFYKEQNELKLEMARNYLMKISDIKAAKKILQPDQPGRKYKMFNDLTDNKFRFEYSLDFTADHIIVRIFGGKDFFEKCESVEKIEISFLRQTVAAVEPKEYHFHQILANTVEIWKEKVIMIVEEHIQKLVHSYSGNTLEVLVPYELNEGISNYNWLGYEVAIYTEVYDNYFQKIGGQTIFFDMSVFPRIISRE